MDEDTLCAAVRERVHATRDEERGVDVILVGVSDVALIGRVIGRLRGEFDLCDMQMVSWGPTRVIRVSWW